MLNRSGIYKITCTANGKVYIGSAVKLKARWAHHKSSATLKKHANKPLQNAWSKYGQDAFKFEVLLVCAKEDLIMYEQRAIDALNPTLNVCRVAGSTLGCSPSEETRQKIREGNTGKKLTSEHKAKIGAAGKGRKMSEFCKLRMAEVHKNKTVSAETRMKQSVAKTGVIVSAETRRKQSVARTGTTRTQETKAKMSAWQIGRKFSAETKAKISDANSKAVMVGGVVYKSVLLAAHALGRDRAAVHRWLRIGVVSRGNGEFSGMAVTRV